MPSLIVQDSCKPVISDTKEMYRILKLEKEERKYVLLHYFFLFSMCREKDHCGCSLTQMHGFAWPINVLPTGNGMKTLGLPNEHFCLFLLKMM